MLARHPDIQERLRDECKSLPSFRDGEAPTREELKGMEYLGRVIREGQWQMIPASRESLLKGWLA